MYYFNVENSAFDETLDMFAQFFTDPLLDPKYVNKEMNAVHSEFEKNINNDYWREQNLFLTRSNPDSKFNRFTIGNLQTLDIPRIYEHLRSFYESHYRYSIHKICSIFFIELLTAVPTE